MNPGTVHKMYRRHICELSFVGNVYTIYDLIRTGRVIRV